MIPSGMYKASGTLTTCRDNRNHLYDLTSIDGLMKLPVEGTEMNDHLKRFQQQKQQQTLY